MSEALVYCAKCKLHETIELRFNNLFGIEGDDGIITSGAFHQEGGYIYHTRCDSPVIEIKG